MCVDKHHFKCCGCLSMTAATILLGVLTLCSAIFYAIREEWASFAIGAFTSLLFFGVLVKPHEANIRKMLFYIASTMSLVGLVATIIVFIVWLNNDTYYEYCTIDD